MTHIRIGEEHIRLLGRSPLPSPEVYPNPNIRKYRSLDEAMRAHVAPTQLMYFSNVERWPVVGYQPLRPLTDKGFRHVRVRNRYYAIVYERRSNGRYKPIKAQRV